MIRSLGVELVPFDLPDVPVAGDRLHPLRRDGGVLRRCDAERRADARSSRARSEARGRSRFARAYLTPAVAFIQANRFRMRVMEQMDEAMSRTGPLHRQPAVADQSHRAPGGQPAERFSSRHADRASLHGPGAR